MGQTLGSLVMDLKSTEVTPEEREMLAHPLVGGVILFSRNYASRPQLIELCRQIRAARRQPCIIMVDQEGGRVQRFIQDFTRLPAMATFGEQFESDQDGAFAAAKQNAYLMASELISAGLDVSLAPVLDLNKGLCDAIGNRAFHRDPTVVTQLAAAFIAGMQEAGMSAVGKHFPGHGSVALDSHKVTPVDERSYQEIERDDLQPFSALVKNDLPAMLASHIIFPAVDKHPAVYSRIWLQQILRDKLGFTGAILTDDLNMEGANISADYADRVLAAREAGCDFALVCNYPQGVVQVLDRVPADKHQVTEDKWRKLQAKVLKGKH